jgi:predicted secreted protein
MLLLARLCRPAEALHAALSRPRDDRGMPSPLQAAAALPSLVDLAAASGEWELLRRACRDRGDEITFAATLVAERQKSQGN